MSDYNQLSSMVVGPGISSTSFDSFNIAMRHDSISSEQTTYCSLPVLFGIHLQVVWDKESKIHLSKTLLT